MLLYQGHGQAVGYYVRLGLFSLFLACRYLMDQHSFAPAATAAMVLLGLFVLVTDGGFPRQGLGTVGTLLALILVGTAMAVVYHNLTLSPLRGWLRYGSYLAAFYVAYKWNLRFQDIGAVFLGLVAIEFAVTLMQFPVSDRPKGTLINSNHLSYLLVLAFAYCLIVVRNSVFAAAVYFFALFLNGLGGIVAVVLVAVTALFFFPDLRRHRLVIVVVVVLTVVFAPSILGGRVEEQLQVTELQAHLDSDSAGGSGSLVWRMVTWRDCIADILGDNAWLFGKGLEYASKASSYFPMYLREEPHNDYVRLFMEVGLVGLLVYLVVFWKTVAELFFRMTRHQDRKAGMFCLVLLALAAGQMVGNIVTQSTLWWTFFGLLGAYRSERRMA